MNQADTPKSPWIKHTEHKTQDLCSTNETKYIETNMGNKISSQLMFVFYI